VGGQLRVLDVVACGILGGPTEGVEEIGVEVGHGRNGGVDDFRTVGDGAVRSPSGPCCRREDASPGNAGAAGGALDEDAALGEEDVALDEGDVAEDIEDSGDWQPRAPTSVVPAIARAARRVDRLRRSAARGFSLKVLKVMPAVKAAACCRPVCGFRYDDDMSGLVASEYACVDRRGRALYGRGHLRWPAPGSHRGGHRR
jgi:hypothetical protein